MKNVFITGASSGIGRATARVLARQNFNLIICGRRRERLEELKKKLSSEANIHILIFNVSDRKAVFEQIESLPEEFKKIDILINNAGNAHGLEPIQDGNIDDWDAMMDINVKGLLYVSRAIIPGMVERKKGHIINIGFTAGKEVYPNGGVYCASKFAVDALNQGMRLDLNAHGIKVGGINPGLTQTEFSEVRFKGDTQKAGKVYDGFEALQAEDIAEIIAFVISRPYHVNIADLTVMPTAQANSTTVKRD